jgi:predicted ribosomally synthesized peptide with SipW-like signal peptide
MKINKRRMTVVAAGVGALGAITALGLGGTSALYTSQADGQTNTIESGTVVLTQDAPHSVEVHKTGFMPGDGYDSSGRVVGLPDANSKYALVYQGADAFVGLDLSISSTAHNACSHYQLGAASITPADLLSNCTATGTVPMFNGDTTSGSLDLSILPENGNTAHQIFDPTALEPGTECSAAVGGLVTCTVEKKNVIVPPGYVSGAANDLVWTNGRTDFISVKPAPPLNASNIFQGSDVTITLTAHAVQKANNADTWLNTTSAGTILANGVSTAPAVLFPKSWS